MRTSNSIKNIIIGLLTQISIIIMGFISRKVFITSLGAGYLGVNGLLTNVLSLLVLVEGGIALSITYNLYKPLSEDNRPVIISLIQLYKKAYGVLAVITLLISVGLFPFLGNLMNKEHSVKYLIIIYAIFVVKNIVSYLNAHKWSLINADQRGYVINRWSIFYQLITIFSRIIILITTHNYILYLGTELFIYIIQNWLNGIIVNKHYSYIKTKQKYPLDYNIKNNIIKNVRALFFHNIGTLLVFGTDNILIASFIGVTTVGLYSNYSMITQQVNALIDPMLGGFSSSVGNLIATETEDKTYKIYKISFLTNFFIYSVSVIFLFNVFQPFITWWLGSKYLIGYSVVTLILFNFYLNGMRTSIQTFKSKAGLFVQDKYAPLIEGAINLGASIIFIHYFGLAGVFVGTALSTITTVLWTQPYFTYKYLFKKPVLPYFSTYIYYTSLTIAMCFITHQVCHYIIDGVSFFSLVERGIVSLFIPSLVYIILFYKTSEFKYLQSVSKYLLGGLKVKLFTSLIRKAS